MAAVSPSNLPKHDRWKAKEAVRRLRLTAGFLLEIKATYLLPVLYGLLGASVYVLRRIMREISEATARSGDWPEQWDEPLPEETPTEPQGEGN